MEETTRSLRRPVTRSSVTFAALLAVVGCSADTDPGNDTKAAPASEANGAGASSTTPAAGATNGAPSANTPPANGSDASAPATSGCGAATPKGTRDVTISVGSASRAFRLHVPPSYDSATKTSLVVNFHGLQSDAFQEEWISKMTGASDAHGFIVAYPVGIGHSFNAGRCCGQATQDGVDDVAFTRALVARIEADACVDTKRIFATGLSNGGHMAYRLACEMADVFGAVASVAGVLSVDESACKPARPIPVLHFHGNADPIVPYDAGPTYGAPASINAFKRKYGCGASTGTQAYKNGDATCVAYDGCSADLQLCTIDGGGHTWPGGNAIPFGKTSKDVDATERMLQFFAAHPLP